MLTRALPVLLLLIVFGCAKNDVEEGATLGIVIPEVIDIGQVRAKDSPAHSSFTIVNHSTIPVEIDEILSGCGCTVIDLPQKIIRPKK